MKNTVYILIISLSIVSVSFSQSVLDFQSGSGVVVGPGADVCADNVIINSNFTGGGSICGATILSLNLTALIQGFYDSGSDSMISDTLTVYLRKSISPYPVLDSYKSILNSAGAATFYFDNISNGINYFIQIQHRNSLETWSFAAIPFSSGNLIFDFTPSVSQAYGSNMIQVNISPVKFAIYSGDINQDGIIDASDLSGVENDASQSLSGYVNSDLTGDDYVDAQDVSIVENNIGVSVITP